MIHQIITKNYNLQLNTQTIKLITVDPFFSISHLKVFSSSKSAALA